MRLVSRLAGTAVPYALSIALTKGVSLALMPWVAAHLSPTEYGRIEVVASIIEFFGLVFACGLADTLFRFAGGNCPADERRGRAASIAGSAIMLAVICAVLLQAAAPLIQGALPIPIDETALRMSLLGVSVGGLIELPLAWLRLRERPGSYLAFTAARALLQLVFIAWMVSRDARAESVLVAAATVELLMAVVLVSLQARSTGLRLTREATRWLRGYSLPLILGGLATFALGSCDRWFLVGEVPVADLGRYGIATKLALATALLMQPFGLWWYARRLTVLGEPGGLERSAAAVGFGFAILFIGGTIMCLVGPGFVRLALPESYLPAVRWIPWLVLACILNESASLLNVGCYARRTTWMVAAVNAGGAAVAILGYVLLIPDHGVDGAIAATIAAHAVRIVGFLAVGHRVARIPYPTLPILTLATASALGVWWVDGSGPIGVQVALVFLAPLALLALAFGLGLIRLEPSGRMWAR